MRTARAGRVSDRGGFAARAGPCIIAAFAISACGSEESVCEPPPEIGEGGLAGCVDRAAYGQAEEAGSSLELVQSALNACSSEIERQLDEMQARIRFPASQRRSYLELLRRELEGEVLRRISQARSGQCSMA